jgi:hypothetical protein
MAINCNKCYTMIISPRVRTGDVTCKHVVTLGSSILPTQDSIRILGVEFCNTLSWVNHSDYVRRKLTCMTGVLKRCDRTLNTDTRLRVYNAFIAPHAAYCLPVWGHLPKMQAGRMEQCMLRILRLITHNPAAQFSNDTCSQLGLRSFAHAVAVRCCVNLATAIG